MASPLPLRPPFSPSGKGGEKGGETAGCFPRLLQIDPEYAKAAPTGPGSWQTLNKF